MARTTILPADTLPAHVAAQMPVYHQYQAPCGYLAQAAVEPNGEVLIGLLSRCCRAAVKYMDHGGRWGEKPTCKGCGAMVGSYLTLTGPRALLSAAKESKCREPLACAQDALWTLCGGE